MLETLTAFLRDRFIGFPGGMLRDIAQGTRKPPGTRLFRVPGYPGANTRRVIGTTRTRTGSDRSGYYPSGTRVVDEGGTTLLCSTQSVRTPSLFYIRHWCRLLLLCYRTAPRIDTDTWDDGRAHGRPPDPKPNPNPNPNAMG